MRKLQEVLADVQTKSRRIDDLFAEAEKRDNKTNTDDELTEIKSLSTELDALEVEAKEAKGIDDIKAKQSQRKAALTQPNGNHEFPTKTADTTKSAIEFPYAASLKHIKGVDRKDAMTKAYRFGAWFLGCLINDLPVPGVYGQFSKMAQYCKDNGLKAVLLPSEGGDPIPVKAHLEGVDVAGGVLVPPEFETTLIDLKEQYGKFRANSKVVPMARETKTVPRRTSGLTAYFVGEADTGTESTKGWDNVLLVAKKLMTLAKFSSELNEDAVINIGDDLAYEIGYAFANKEDECGFNGDGTSTYGGIVGVRNALLNLSATIANIAGLVVATGNAYSEITLADFNKVVGRLPQYADTPNARWFMHKTFYHEVAEKLSLAAGGVTSSEVASGMRQFRFLGYPVEVAQVMPKTEANSQVVALLGDLALASKFGDRRQTTLFVDPYSLTTSDQIQIRGTERFDINVHDVGNADATAANRVPGPIVGLITAAS